MAIRHPYADKTALLLDMNGTFMFGEDRFDETQNFAAAYYAAGGEVTADTVNRIILEAYAWLDSRYRLPQYREHFPAVADAFRAVIGGDPDRAELQRLVTTFAQHECGHIPAAYATALQRLAQNYLIGFVIDIWAPKATWLREFSRLDIDNVATAVSFSSDHGMVKPSPQPFLMVLEKLGVSADKALVIGDSADRDLCGALAAGIDCVLVGGATDRRAIACVDNLLGLSERIAP